MCAPNQDFLMKSHIICLSASSAPRTPFWGTVTSRHLWWTRNGSRGHMRSFTHKQMQTSARMRARRNSTSQMPPPWGLHADWSGSLHPSRRERRPAPPIRAGMLRFIKMDTYWCGWKMRVHLHQLCCCGTSMVVRCNVNHFERGNGGWQPDCRLHWACHRIQISCA